MKPLSAPEFFPSPDSASPEGLLSVGGRLSPEWLLDAYSHGIFPWPVSERLLAWWTPDPRAVLEPADLHVPRRLERTIRSGRFEVTADRAFGEVIEGCATANGRRRNTWITPSMQAAYRRLHELGHAHSVEVWRDGWLAGGTYGVALGAMFAAESMFYRESDASKVALVALVRHLGARGYTLLDIQQMTSNSARFGAREIPRAVFLARLARAIQQPVTFGARLEGAATS